ncbi:MAG TPA: glycoside hydrolase, partial [Spirochaetia bacterium]|nr:glycoside hydrolase [Spirochaetia bacterium]
VENLLTGYRISGHSYAGIIAGTLEQYVHLGDACTMTDNLAYDPKLAADKVKDGRSGKRDDRWVFTSRDSSLEYLVIASLAAAGRILKGYDDELARECLATAFKAWRYEQEHEPVENWSAYVPGRRPAMEALAACVLLSCTGEEEYKERLRALLPEAAEHFFWVGGVFARAISYMQDESFTASVQAAAVAYRENREKEWISNPFGVPYFHNIWGVGWLLQRYALQEYFLHRAFPDLFPAENIFQVVHYALGCHPASNLSLVSGVGAQSVTATYGVNRAEYSYIPGGNVSGPSLILPDFPELKSPYPFLWQQTEYVMSGAASYIFCVLAADKLLNT